MSKASGATIGSVKELADDVRSALRDLILGLADSKRILGIRYADWVLGAPELEASIACSSMSQDEWGHSRILYALLKEFGDDPGRIEHERDAEEYRNIEALDEPLETWSDFVATNALVDTALTVQLEALDESAFAPLRQRVSKQLDEERFHFSHGAAWVAKLGKASDEARRSLGSAIEARWSATLHWFGPEDFAAALEAAGFSKAAGGGLRADFLARVGPILERGNLNVPETKLDFSIWDPATRRMSGGGPRGDAVARARGDRNRAFLMD